jgi:cobalamin biosynthesis protein CbiD
MGGAAHLLGVERPVSDDESAEALRREIVAVREASRPGELVAVTPDDGRSLARQVGRTTVRYVLWWTLAVSAIVALTLLLP